VPRAFKLNAAVSKYGNPPGMEFGYRDAAGVQQRNDLSQLRIDMGGDKAQQRAH
jgi:hypothetical protein